MLEDTFNYIKRMDYVIRGKRAKTPKMLADTIGLSQRQTYYYLRLMKDLGAPIVYNSHDGYHYTEEGNFIIGFQAKKESPSI